MTRSLKIGLSVGAAFLLIMGCATAAAVYYAVSFIQARALFEEAYKTMNQRDYKKATEQFDHALHRPLDPFYAPYAYFNRGFCHEKLDQSNEALSDYSQAIKLKPDLTEAYSYRAALHERRKEKAEALKDYGEVIGRDPNAWWPLFQRGRLYAQQKEWDKAIADFSEVVRASPNYVAGYIQRGIAYKEKNDWDAALANFEAAISINPKSSSAYLQRSYVYRHKGETEKEIDNFTQAIRANPTDQFSLEHRGNAYLQKGDVDHAIIDFTALIDSAKSRKRRPYELRGCAHARKGDYLKAQSDFEAARRIEGSTVPSGKTLPWLLATCPDAKLRNGKEAVSEALADCESTHWNNSDCIDTLAAAYAEEKEFDQAIAFEQLAMEKPYCEGARKIDMEKRLALYQKHQPYRDSSGP